MGSLTTSWHSFSARLIKFVSPQKFYPQNRSALLRRRRRRRRRRNPSCLPASPSRSLASRILQCHSRGGAGNGGKRAISRKRCSRNEKSSAGSKIICSSGLIHLFARVDLPYLHYSEVSLITRDCLRYMTSRNSP